MLRRLVSRPLHLLLLVAPLYALKVDFGRVLTVDELIAHGSALPGGVFSVAPGGSQGPLLLPDEVPSFTLAGVSGEVPDGLLATTNPPDAYWVKVPASATGWFTPPPQPSLSPQEPNPPAYWVEVSASATEWFTPPPQPSLPPQEPNPPNTLEFPFTALTWTPLISRLESWGAAVVLRAGQQLSLSSLSLFLKDVSHPLGQTSDLTLPTLAPSALFRVPPGATLTLEDVTIVLSREQLAAVFTGFCSSTRDWPRSRGVSLQGGNVLISSHTSRAPGPDGAPGAGGEVRWRNVSITCPGRGLAPLQPCAARAVSSAAELRAASAELLNATIGTVFITLAANITLPPDDSWVPPEIPSLVVLVLLGDPERPTILDLAGREAAWVPSPMPMRIVVEVQSSETGDVAGGAPVTTPGGTPIALADVPVFEPGATPAGGLPVILPGAVPVVSDGVPVYTAWETPAAAAVPPAYAPGETPVVTGIPPVYAPGDTPVATAVPPVYAPGETPAAAAVPAVYAPEDTPVEPRDRPVFTPGETTGAAEAPSKPAAAGMAGEAPTANMPLGDVPVRAQEADAHSAATSSADDSDRLSRRGRAALAALPYAVNDSTAVRLYDLTLVNLPYASRPRRPGGLLALSALSFNLSSSFRTTGSPGPWVVLKRCTLVVSDAEFAFVEEAARRNSSDLYQLDAGGGTFRIDLQPQEPAPPDASVTARSPGSPLVLPVLSMLPEVELLDCTLLSASAYSALPGAHQLLPSTRAWPPEQLYGEPQEAARWGPIGLRLASGLPEALSMQSLLCGSPPGQAPVTVIPGRLDDSEISAFSLIPVQSIAVDAAADAADPYSGMCTISGYAAELQGGRTYSDLKGRTYRCFLTRPLTLRNLVLYNLAHAGVFDASDAADQAMGGVGDVVSVPDAGAGNETAVSDAGAGVVVTNALWATSSLPLWYFGISRSIDPQSAPLLLLANVTLVIPEPEWRALVAAVLVRHAPGDVLAAAQGRPRAPPRPQQRESSAPPATCQPGGAPAAGCRRAALQFAADGGEPDAVAATAVAWASAVVEAATRDRERAAAAGAVANGGQSGVADASAAAVSDAAAAAAAAELRGAAAQQRRRGALQAVAQAAALAPERTHRVTPGVRDAADAPSPRRRARRLSQITTGSDSGRGPLVNDPLPEQSGQPPSLVLGAGSDALPPTPPSLPPRSVVGQVPDAPPPPPASPAPPPAPPEPPSPPPSLPPPPYAETTRAALLAFAAASKPLSYDPASGVLVLATARHHGWVGTNVTLTYALPPDAPPGASLLPYPPDVLPYQELAEVDIDVSVEFPDSALGGAAAGVASAASAGPDTAPPAAAQPPQHPSAPGLPAASELKPPGIPLLTSGEAPGAGNSVRHASWVVPTAAATSAIGGTLLLLTVTTAIAAAVFLRRRRHEAAAGARSPAAAGARSPAAAGEKPSAPPRGEGDGACGSVTILLCSGVAAGDCPTDASSARSVALLTCLGAGGGANGRTGVAGGGSTTCAPGTVSGPPDGETNLVQLRNAATEAACLPGCRPHTQEHAPSGSATATATATTAAPDYMPCASTATRTGNQNAGSRTGPLWSDSCGVASQANQAAVRHALARACTVVPLAAAPAARADGGGPRRAAVFGADAEQPTEVRCSQAENLDPSPERLRSEPLGTSVCERLGDSLPVLLGEQTAPVRLDGKSFMRLISIYYSRMRGIMSRSVDDPGGAEEGQGGGGRNGSEDTNLSLLGGRSLRWPGAHVMRRRPGTPREMGEAVRALQAEMRDAELVIHAVLGRGSFGMVYRGLWRGLPVAVKALVVPDAAGGREGCARQRAVLEAAISMSMAHPNIVATYNYDLKPLVQKPPGRPLTPSPSVQDRHPTLSHGPSTGVCGSGPKTSELGADEARLQSTEYGQGEADGAGGGGSRGSGSGCDAYKLYIVQELCDGGSLRQALVQGMAGSVRAGGSFRALALRLALDVALGMRHVHSCRVVHGDLKPDNVLLVSGPSPRSTSAASLKSQTAGAAPAEAAPAGRSGRSDLAAGGLVPLTAKVADFGLSMPLQEGATHASRHFHGTPAYAAPEVLSHGQLSPRADVWSFGLMLIELFYGCTLQDMRALHAVMGAEYEGQCREVALHAILLRDMLVSPQRPFAELAAACLAVEPRQRPGFAGICEKLRAMVPTDVELW